MSIFINNDTRLLVQGITGREGSFHTSQMIEYGTQVVAGLTPGKGGMKTEHGVPVYNTAKEALEAHPEINASIIFVPPPFAADSILEALDAEIPLIVCITEGIPTLDMMRVFPVLEKSKSRLIGPNCPGLTTPGEAKLGIMPAMIFKKGSVGVVSRSGTLTYEIAADLTNRGYGQSTIVGIGGDPIIGTNFVDVLKAFEADPETELVVMAGEIGGSAEEDAADYIKNHMTKPVVGFIGGRTAPEGKRMGHAGALVSGNKGTAQGKVDALIAAGVPVADTTAQIGDLVVERMKKLAAVK
ncbi:Succinyl-CoA ligase [ADP-forming] subunit alpha [compost metagenome]